MEPHKLATCRLLAEVNGIDTRGEAWTVREGWTGRWGPRAKCDVASECRDCRHFQEFVDEITQKVGGRVLWACFRCIGGPQERAPGVLLGYYASGKCDLCRSEAILLNALLTGAAY